MDIYFIAVLTFSFNLVVVVARAHLCVVIYSYCATLQRNFADVEDVKFVINFDYPNNSEDYIHRIGRTARSQKTGTAYTFFTHNNVRQAGDLVSVLREANQAINPKLLQMVDDRGGKFDAVCAIVDALSPYASFKARIPVICRSLERRQLQRRSTG